MALTGNTVLVTGGGSGIGRGLAEALHARGNRVIVAGRREAVLADVVAANPGIASLRLDVSDRENIAEAAARLIRERPELDMLVNAAGIAWRDDAAAPIDDALLTATVETNVYGPIRLGSALIEHFKRRSAAAIVHVTSSLAYLPHAELAIYSASKAMLHAYLLAQRYRLRGSNIAVIEIAPPMVATALDGNADNPHAMPLDAYIAETMAAMDSGAEEALVSSARARRERIRPDEQRLMDEFNDMLAAG